MARGKNGETLQAVEIGADTFIGVAASEGGAGSLVHLLADGDITFNFNSGTKALTGLKAGMDFVAGPGCKGITSTAAVVID
jgi:hypothetical protein